MADPACTPFVVDASVAVKWFLEEEFSGEAESLLASSSLLIAPDLLRVEVANALWSLARRKRIKWEQARQALLELFTMDIECVPSEQLLAAALQLAQSLEHPVYGCLYLACTDICDGILITADARLQRAVSNSALEEKVRLLGRPPF